MTVAEAIEELQRFDPSMVLKIEWYESHGDNGDRCEEEAVSVFDDGGCVVVSCLERG